MKKFNKTHKNENMWKMWKNKNRKSEKCEKCEKCLKYDFCEVSKKYIKDAKSCLKVYRNEQSADMKIWKK
jgi:hypothetical protein